MPCGNCRETGHNRRTCSQPIGRTRNIINRELGQRIFRIRSLRAAYNQVPRTPEETANYISERERLHNERMGLVEELRQLQEASGPRLRLPPPPPAPAPGTFGSGSFLIRHPPAPSPAPGTFGSGSFRVTPLLNDASGFGSTTPPASTPAPEASTSTPAPEASTSTPAPAPAPGTFGSGSFRMTPLLNGASGFGSTTPPASTPAPEASTSTPAPESEEPPREVKVIESESCMVCMEDFDGKMKIDKATLKCGHQICSGCLVTWMRENHTCPSCREPIAERIPKKFTLTRGVREHIVADMSNTGRRNGNFQRILELITSTPAPSESGGVDQRLRYIEYEMENMVIAGLRQAERILNTERGH